MRANDEGAQRCDQAIFKLNLLKFKDNTESPFTETFLAMAHGFMGWLACKKIPLTRVCFNFPEPRYVKEYDMLFDCPYVFDQPSAALEFPKSCLSWPINRAVEELIPFLKHSPLGILARPETDKSLIIKTRSILLQGCEEDLDFPSPEQVAELLGLTEGTLRRRLRKEGTSYKVLKDTVRRDIAIKLLSDPKKSVGEVACVVGFSEPCAFSRAFRDWTGLPPSAYRNSGDQEYTH